MCIACELGYWAMIDALEAERDAAKKNSIDNLVFTCEPGSEKVDETPPLPAQRTVNESTP
jgi:hypothetical protein